MKIGDFLDDPELTDDLQPENDTGASPSTSPHRTNRKRLTILLGAMIALLIVPVVVRLDRRFPDSAIIDEPTLHIHEWSLFMGRVLSGRQGAGVGLKQFARSSLGMSLSALNGRHGGLAEVEWLFSETRCLRSVVGWLFPP
jgi:hypothetical protein